MSTRNEENSVLKKAGMVAVAAMAGVLALSPLAFATGADNRGDPGGDSGTSTSVEDNSVERNQVNQCEFEQDSASTGLLGPLLPLLNQGQQLNCVNVGDGSSIRPPSPPGPGPGSEVVYNSIPDDLPGGVPSLGYQANSTSEFGDQVGLASGPNPELESVEVVLVSWACETGNWIANNCVTTPGATFDHPITINVYAVDESGSTPTPGPLLASQTELSSIPYRPSADPVNCTGPNAGQWLDPSDNACKDGFAHRLTINFAGNTPLPDQVIWTVAFNTTNFGPNPIGPAPCFSSPDNCDYNWLNVGARTFPGAPFEGTDTDPSAAFLDSSWAGAYCDSGAGGTGFLRHDSPCWTGNTPLGKITARTGQN
jgi:hypothetical protein